MITAASPTALRWPFSRSSSWASAAIGVSEPPVAAAWRVAAVGISRPAIATTIATKAATALRGVGRRAMVKIRSCPVRTC